MKKATAETQKGGAATPPGSPDASMPASPPPPTGTPEAVVPVEPPPLTASELEELRARAATAAESWDRLLRTTADFDNFKKRAARERADAVKFANETLMQKLIPVLDHFEMARTAAQASPVDGAESLQSGIAMIHQQLKSILAEFGLEELDATGKPFDPKLHEAVSQQETADVPEGHVFQQLRKGYRLRERLLRPASVVVAKPPTPHAE